MSGPDPKEWEVTDAVLQATALAVVKAVVSAVARVRALAELKALAKTMCDFCEKGVEFAVHPFEPKTRFHNGEDRGYWECQCPEIHDRIAEIEAE